MTAQNGVGGSPAFRQPEADPLILKEMNNAPPPCSRIFPLRE